MFNGTLIGVAKYLRDANGKDASIVESITDGGTETVYMLFGIDPRLSGETGLSGYMRKLVITTVTSEGGAVTETLQVAHANGRWAHRANQNWVSIAVKISNAPVVLPS
jgi:hypothetical protein